MKILINERLSEHKVKTPEGYLICMDAILARTGKQTYKRSEIFSDSTDDSEVEVDRTEDEVFSPQTLASFENKPVTVEHPDEDVNVHNHKEYAVGFVRDIRRGKVNGQDVMLGNLVITDEQAIKDVEDGTYPDLSCGYDCDIADDDHPTQRNIRGNHVALCQQGRAGIAKIVDSVKDDFDIDKAITVLKQYMSGHPAPSIQNVKDILAVRAGFTKEQIKEFTDRIGIRTLREMGVFDSVNDSFDIEIDLGFKKTKESYNNRDEADDRYEELMKLSKKPSMSGMTVKKLYDSIEDATYTVGIISQSDNAEYYDVEANSEQEAIAKVKKLYRPYRVFECRKVKDDWTKKTPADTKIESMLEIEVMNDEIKTKRELIDRLRELEKKFKTTYPNDIVKEFARKGFLIDSMEDSMKDSFVEATDEIKLAKQKIAQVGFKVLREGKTMFGRHHIEFEVTKDKYEAAKKLVDMLSDQLEKRGVPMTFNISESLGVIDIDKKYVKDSTKDAIIEAPETIKFVKQKLAQTDFKIRREEKEKSGKYRIEFEVTKRTYALAKKFVLALWYDITNRTDSSMNYYVSESLGVITVWKDTKIVEAMQAKDSTKLSKMQKAINAVKAINKDSVKDTKMKQVTELKEADIIRDGTGARWLISVIRKGVAGQITLRVNGIDDRGSTAEWTFYSDHKTAFTVLDSVKDDINWEHVKNKVKADKWLQEHGLYDEFLAKGLYKKYTDYEYAKLKGMKDSK